MTAYARNATGDYDDSAKWTPNGVPGATDTATIGAFTVTIATGKTWTPGALALTGTGSSTRAKIVIADGGKLAQYGDITANAYNEVLMQGNSEWDLRGFKTYYTVQTGSNVNNKITNDGLGKAKIYSSTTLGRIANDATTASYGCLQLNNFQITNIDFCFGAGYYAGHHYDLQNGVFLAAGYVETSLYANNSSDYRVKKVDLIGCKNPKANVMAHFRADKDVSGGTVTGIRDISKVTFRNEIPLAYVSVPSGYTEVTLSSPNLTVDMYIGFFFQELVTGDRIWLPATGVTCDTAGQIVATSITARTIYIVDTSRGVAQPYSINFLPGTFYIDVVTYPQVTWRNLAFAPTEVYYDKVTHSSLLKQGGTLQNFFSANVTAFGDTSRPIRESYIFPAKNNPHTMVNSCSDFQYNILESVQPANSNDGGDHFIVTAAGTHNIMYNLIIDNYGGVCVNALGVASRTGTYNFKHNTYVADARSAVYGGLVRNEASGVFSTASSLNVLDNICHVRSNPTGATSFRAYNLETSGNDQVKTFDNNAYSNCGSPQSSILNGISSATKSIGDNLFGMHDFYSELPGFVDETRGLQKWATQYGATTQEQAVDFVVNGVNGYDPVTMTQIPGNVQAQGLTSLIAYVREGFKPTNIAYKDSGTDNITRGALAFAPDTVPDPFTFGSTTGANPSTVTTSSTRVTVSGVTASVDIAAVPTGGLGYRVSTDGGTSFGAWTTTTSNVQLGYVIEARVTSSSAFSTPVTGTLTIGGVAGTWQVTTRAQDVTPSNADFGTKLNAAFSTITASTNQATITGIDSDASISAIPDAGLEFRRSTDGGSTFGSWLSTTLTGNQLNYIFEARLTSSSSFNTSVTKNLTVGGVAFPYTVVTLADSSSGVPSDVKVTVRSSSAQSIVGRSLVVARKL